MPYLEQSDILGQIPPLFLTEALDDDGDGHADPGAWEAVEAAATEQVDAKLGQRFPVPFPAPLPALVKQAARIFVLESLYRRRGAADDENPWVKQANEMRAKLSRIGNGEEPLTPSAKPARPSVSVISQPSPSHSRRMNG